MMPPRPNQPQQPPIPETPPVVLNKFDGLKNTVEATRLTAQDLEFAINVDLDDVGQLHRRRGKIKVASGSFGSLYTTSENVVFGTKNGSLGVIRPDYSFIPIDTGYPLDPLAYVQVGSTLYFSSRTRAGKVRLHDFQVTPWGALPDLWLSPVVNPVPSLPQIRGKLLGPPPLATILAYFNGRIYMGSDNMVWATEMYLYDYVDKTKNFWQFEAEVTMIGTVTDGLYVGTTEGLWFISGKTFAEMSRQRVMDNGVIPGSMVYAPAEIANPGTVQVPIGQRQDTDQKVAVLFLTQAGYCGGQDGGVCFNYTEQKFEFPDVRSATSVFRRQDGTSQYLAVANSGGTPSASARIGDHVDVQLVRGGGRWDTVAEGINLGDVVTAVVV